MSGGDTPSPGDAKNNPIVLDSDDEAGPIPISTQRDTTITSSSNPSQSISQRKNLQQVSPSGSNHSARCHDSQSRNSPPAVSDTRDENVPAVREATTSEHEITEEPPPPMQSHITEPPSTPTTPLLPHPDLQSVEPAVDEPPTANINTDQMPSPIQNGSEVCDNVPNTVSGSMCGGPSRVGSSSSSPISPKSRNMEISPRTAVAHNPSSPNRGHDLQTNSSANASPIRVRGTLFSGPSGLWKNYFRAATGEKASPSRPSRAIGDQGDARPKEGSDNPPINSPRNVSSSTLVSLTRNMSIRTSPTRSAVASRDTPETPDDIAIATPGSVSSVTSGEFSKSITSRRHSVSHRLVHNLK